MRPVSRPTIVAILSAVYCIVLLGCDQGTSTTSAPDSSKDRTISSLFEDIPPNKPKSSFYDDLPGVQQSDAKEPQYQQDWLRQYQEDWERREAQAARDARVRSESVLLSEALSRDSINSPVSDFSSSHTPLVPPSLSYLSDDGIKGKPIGEVAMPRGSGTNDPLFGGHDGGMVHGGPLTGAILPGREGGMVHGGPLTGTILPGREGGMIHGGPLSGTFWPGEAGGMIHGGPMSGSIIPGTEGGMIHGGPMSGTILPPR